MYLRMKRFTFVFLSLTLAACGSCEEETTEESASTQTEDEPPPFEPLPESVEFDEAKMALGRALYFDTRLSGDDTISCASCHMLDHGGAEPEVVSTGINGSLGPINAPTVLNSRYNLAQFWDGRAADLQEQAAGPVANPIEMGATFDDVVAKLQAVPEYVEAFAAVYDDGITQDNITDAIAHYEETLVTPSRFDQFLRGDEDALSAQEKRGYETFVDVGCTACHQGINIGGSMYQKMGLVEDWFSTLDRELTEADNGRFNHTGNEADKFFFKVPTLRNIANTAPYMHDGSQTELAAMVRIMARHQLGAEVTDQQVDDIVAFLNSLTGEIPAHAALPEDGIPGGPVTPAEGEGTEGEGEGETVPTEAEGATEAG
jgi:cytochrome c peroxidase